MTLGVGEAGTAPEDIELTHPATLTSRGVFTEVLEGAEAGSVIAAEACAGGTCALQSTIAQ